MYADIERESFDPQSHFSRLLHHQGSVLLASDLNEHGAIFQHYLRQFIIDFVGKRWRTTGSFKIGTIESVNFEVSAGHFYLDGILCVNEADKCWYGKEKDKFAQPMFPTPEWDIVRKVELDKLSYAIYLECWERHVSSLQIPTLREGALGGPDPTSRLQIAWQVRVLTTALAKSYSAEITSAMRNVPIEEHEITAFNKIYEEFETSIKTKIDPKHCAVTQNVLDVLDTADPRLRVWAKRHVDEVDACEISPDAQYSGLGNQHYRVEIHQSGTVLTDKNHEQPSFKWSRENGSVVFPIVPASVSPVSGSAEVTLDLETLGRDVRYGLCINDWVELTGDEIEFAQKVLPLAKVTKIDTTLGRVTLVTNDNAGFSGCTLLRRWDQKDGALNDIGTINITEASDDEYEQWIPLEFGVRIQFQPGGNYRKGDYWLIPARVATGDVLWPKTKNIIGMDVPVARPTDGVKRHRAALAVVVAGKAKTECGCVLDAICKGK